MEPFRILTGDCLERLKEMGDNCVDSIVTDPPAAISFMSQRIGWDGDKGGRQHWVAWLTAVMQECYRVLKPGGHVLVWSLPRTAHWTATAVEDGGFYIKGKVYHHFGQGWPKSKHQLKPATEEWVFGQKPCDGTVKKNIEKWGTGTLRIDDCRVPAAGRPLRMTGNNDNEERHAYGTGLKGCRAVGTTDVGRFPADVVFTHSPECGESCSEDCPAHELDEQSGHLKSGFMAAGQERKKSRGHGGYGDDLPDKAILKESYADEGGGSRFFMNFPGSEDCADGCPAKELDSQSGYTKTKRIENPSEATESTMWHGSFQTNRGARGHSDEGGSSRFFWCSKAAPSERNKGLEDFYWRLDSSRPSGVVRASKEEWDALLAEEERIYAETKKRPRLRGEGNVHVTVKPLNLVRYLARLITPEGGVVLDPFLGSGSVLCAAALEGLRGIGIEECPEYVEIAEARLAYWRKGAGE